MSVSSFSRLCDQPASMPASICGAAGWKPLALAFTVSLVRPPCSSKVTIVSDSRYLVPSRPSAKAVNRSRSGLTTSVKIPGIG